MVEGDEKLSEEAVYLAASMPAAGYRTVFAITWAIQDNDLDAPVVPEKVYMCMLGPSCMGKGRGIAYVLRHAFLRDKGYLYLDCKEGQRLRRGVLLG